jgi:hypothetical protein
MIWSLKQVAAMEGYRFSQAVDMFVIERAASADGTNPALVATAEHLFRGLQEAGHTWGLEIDREDCEVRVDPASDGHFMDVVRMRWNPKTTTGLLVGGPAGGKVYDMAPGLHRVGVSVVIERTEPPLFDPSAKVPTAVATDTYFYAYAGWSEARRMWVYGVVPER